MVAGVFKIQILKVPWQKKIHLEEKQTNRGGKKGPFLQNSPAQSQFMCQNLLYFSH